MLGFLCVNRVGQVGKIISDLKPSVAKDKWNLKCASGFVYLGISEGGF